MENVPQTDRLLETIDRIAAEADRFAAGSADDPKDAVDALMASIEATLSGLDAGASAHLDGLDEKARALLGSPEAEGATPPVGGGDPRNQRRMRFLRSIVQLLDARRAIEPPGSTAGR